MHRPTPVDFEPEPRVPLILGRCFLKTGRALIDVHKDYVIKWLVRNTSVVLGFTDIIASGNSTPYYDPIVATSSLPHKLHFGDSDFLLHRRCRLFLKPFLNSEPPLPPPSPNSSVEEPTEVELKELPPHLEYAFLEGDNKLPVIIAKKCWMLRKKYALVKVLKCTSELSLGNFLTFRVSTSEFCYPQVIMEEGLCNQTVHQSKME
ncbi:hypothetical protein Tco_1467102 [Tanacetum coccineum]